MLVLGPALKGGGHLLLLGSFIPWSGKNLRGGEHRGGGALGVPHQGGSGARGGAAVKEVEGRHSRRDDPSVAAGGGVDLDVVLRDGRRVAQLDPRDAAWVELRAHLEL